MVKLVDVYNTGEATVWFNGKPLRGGGGRWLKRDLADVVGLADVDGVVVVPAGTPSPMTPPAEEPEEDLVVILDDEPEVPPAPRPQTVVDVEPPSLRDRLMAWELLPIEDLTVHDLAQRPKDELLELAEDIDVQVSRKWTKLKIADYIYQRALSEHVHGAG